MTSGRSATTNDGSPGSGELLHTHLPDKPLQANSPHDINIQTNTLAVIVLDEATRRPVPGATVNATAPLAVMLGPSPTAMPPDVPDGVDIFTVQRHAVHFPRKSAGDGSAVIFD